MKKVSRVVYAKKDFKDVITPSWQRWTNEKNVSDLAQAVIENGQLRDVLVCVTDNGSKILTDGKHLKEAMIEVIKSRKVNVIEKRVRDNEEARKTFMSFNTRGRTLSPIDYVVSFAGSGLSDYKKFLSEVMQSPKNEKEASDVRGKLFTVSALINIFLGTTKNTKDGKGKLPKRYNRLLSLMEYLSENYLLDGRIISHLKKNGRSMRLNGGSIIPVFLSIKQSDYIMSMTNIEIMDLLIDFTYYHYNSMENCAFNKDSVSQSFPIYISKLNK